MHKIVEVTLRGKIYTAPIAQNPQRILDIGTGTGIWAMEMGEFLRQGFVVLRIKERGLTAVRRQQVTNFQTQMYEAMMSHALNSGN